MTAHHVDVQYLGREALKEVPLGRVVSVRGLETALPYHHIVRGDAALQEATAARTAIQASSWWSSAAETAAIARRARLALREDAVRRVVEDAAFAAGLPAYI